MKKYVESIIFLVIFILCFMAFSIPMGLSNTMSTIMNTAFDLLINTCLYIMAISVIAGAFSGILSEFGVIDLIDKILAPLMKPLYGMPGASSLGIITTFCSDNAAILTLANDPNYRKHFKMYQIPALTNIGTAFGMGLIVITYMLGLSNKCESGNVGLAVLMGFLGAVIGSIISTRIMLHHTKKGFGTEVEAYDPNLSNLNTEVEDKKEKNGLFLRILNSSLEGGKRGVDVGIGIIPGVCIICTIVLMLTNGAPADGIYTGAAYEGIGVLPIVAEKLDFILNPLFGFTSSTCIAIPITSLGSAGAAIGLVPELLENGLCDANDIAVFTAMCMCWSGYLSTHASMMDVLNTREYTGKSIMAHTIGGLFAGISAHFLYTLFVTIF